ncbi:CLUMA_CG015047, isoform A [Clunio marinus]|uniref:CLUMA_CG015047, isoform A n=1 Tax=Clunio marinus TaxID=568069 RepID=A0A1J1IPW2_9DIPT|nr:CLUMA_CG015047, isoform A [Clunio marinus]
MKSVLNLVCLGLLLMISKSLCDYENATNDSSYQFETPSSFYTAAVVEFHAPGDELIDPEEIVEANLDEYLRLIDEASIKGVDILVFPEASLNYNGIKTRENLSEIAVEIQTEVPDITNCDYSHDVILNELSYAVSNASIYALVNVVEIEFCNDTELCSDDGFNLYNTNIVFDRNGCIISRYRKFNLFIEPFMNVTKEPDVATFETDFGVTFGHFICFDILFKSPALDLINLNVTHLLYPSMWYSETPFLTSVQIQQSFAHRKNIVLLSSGTNSPENSNTGSGIYIGRHGAVDKIISFKNETRMIIAEIPKNVDDQDYVSASPTVKSYISTDMDKLKLWNYKPQNIFPLHKHFVTTIGKVSCEFTIKYVKLDIPEGHIGYSYRLTAFSGIRTFSGLVNAGEINCAIISCYENDDNTCGKKIENTTNLVPSLEFLSIDIKVTIEDNSENYQVMPTTLKTSLLPLQTNKYEFVSVVDDDIQIYNVKSSEKLSDLMTFGIYGRNFNLDEKMAQKKLKTVEIFLDNRDASEITYFDEDDDSIEIKMTIYVILMVGLSIVTAIMVYRKLQHPYVKPDLGKRKSFVS